MQNVLIVSDIYGFTDNLVESVGLGGINRRCLQLFDICGRPDLRGEDLHDYIFNRDGMRHAVRTLCKTEVSSCIGIGFSAGGTALWNAAKEGFKLDALICVSSTRLRFEEFPLDIPNIVFWGELDPCRPEERWHTTVPRLSKSYSGKQHDFYRNDMLVCESPLRVDIENFIKNWTLK